MIRIDRNGRSRWAGTIKDLLTFEELSRTSKTRLAYRCKWLERAYEATATCDVVFLDPDNGLAGSILSHHRAGPKYVFLSEIEKYLCRGQSVVIYHHFGRQGAARHQLTRLFERLLPLASAADLFAMVYHRGSSRVFLVLEAPSHRPHLLQRATRFLDGPWSRHFELVNPALKRRPRGT